jgi:carboxymethylenebutenolidase
MPEYLPYPSQLVNGSESTPGKRYEYKVPVGGIEVASKLRDRNSVSSNEMFKFRVKEVEEPQTKEPNL